MTILALKKRYYPENWQEWERWQEYERLKAEISEKAKTHEEYERLNRELLDRLGL